MGTPYDKKDAAEDTNSSTKEVSKAWHQARDDAAEEKGWRVPQNRHKNDNSSDSSDNGGDSSGK